MAAVQLHAEPESDTTGSTQAGFARLAPKMCIEKVASQLPGKCQVGDYLINITLNCEGTRVRPGMFMLMPFCPDMLVILVAGIPPYKTFVEPIM